MQGYKAFLLGMNGIEDFSCEIGHECDINAKISTIAPMGFSFYEDLLSCVRSSLPYQEEMIRICIVEAEGTIQSYKGCAIQYASHLKVIKDITKYTYPIVQEYKNVDAISSIVLRLQRFLVRTALISFMAMLFTGLLRISILQNVCFWIELASVMSYFVCVPISRHYEKKAEASLQIFGNQERRPQ